MIAIMWHAQRAQWSAQCTSTLPTQARRISNKITAESMHVCNASSIRMNIDAVVFRFFFLLLVASSVSFFFFSANIIIMIVAIIIIFVCAQTAAAAYLRFACWEQNYSFLCLS